MNPEPKRGFARLGQILYRWALALLPLLLFYLYSARPVPPSLERAVDLSWYWVLVPWLLLYTDNRHPKVSLGYFVPVAWLSWMALYPVTHRFGVPFTLVASTVFMLPWLPFPPVMRRIHARLHLPRTLTVPFIWVALELTRATFSLAHLDLYRLGYSQTFTNLMQIADVTGVYGVSFLMAAVNGLLADLFFAVRDREGSLTGALLQKRIAVPAGVVVLLFAVALTYGTVRVQSVTFTPGPSLAIIQPNIGHTQANAVGVHLEQVAMTDELIRPGSADLIAWPENAILDHMERAGAYLDDLAWLANRKQAWFLVGSMGRPEETPGRTSNTAYLVDENGKIQGSYDKQLLFPWSEYVPWDGFLARTYPSLQHMYRTLIRKGWGHLPAGVQGSGMNTMSFPWQGSELSFAALICYENTYPPIPASGARQGARFFVNLTSEGRIGGPMQEQLLRLSIARAVENRIAYVRVGNTGISGFIDPRGRMQSTLRGRNGQMAFDQGAHVDRVPLREGGPTIYTRSHDAFAKFCALVTVVLYIWSWIPGRRAATAAATAALLVGTGGCLGPPELGDDPSQARAAFEQGLRASRQAPKQAIESFTAACADPQICAGSLDYLFRAFTRTGQPEKGAVVMENIAERHPELAARAVGYRGALLEAALDVVAADREYRRSLSLSPTDFAYSQLGNLRLRLGDHDNALEAFRSGLEIKPGDIHLRYLLGRALRIAGRLDESRQVLEQVVADDPRHSHAWTNLGRLDLLVGEPVEGERKLRHAILLDSGNVEARFRLVKKLFREERRGEALRLIAEIRALEEGHEGGS